MWEETWAPGENQQRHSGQHLYSWRSRPGIEPSSSGLWGHACGPLRRPWEIHSCPRPRLKSCFTRLCLWRTGWLLGVIQATLTLLLYLKMSKTAPLELAICCFGYIRWTLEAEAKLSSVTCSPVVIDTSIYSPQPCPSHRSPWTALFVFLKVSLVTHLCPQLLLIFLYPMQNAV